MFSDMDLYDEADIYDRELMEDIKFEKEINPTVVAQQEFFDNKIRLYYEKDDEQKDV